MRFTIAASLMLLMSTVACERNDPPKLVKASVTPEPARAIASTKVSAGTPVDTVAARGAYLADVMGCAQCHTAFGPQGPDLSKAYAGGLEVPEEFGTWRSTNITQDKETGIGSWTDEQIIVAIREGKRPDGQQLFPVMPYMFYNAMSDADAEALVGFLRTIDGIPNEVTRATDLKLPLIAVPPAVGTEVDANDAVAHGGYLASLMHCAACHTPMGPKGPDMARAFAGGMKFEIPMLGEGAMYSSNLTPHETGIGSWEGADIATSIRDLKKRDGSPIQGAMALYQGWSKLTDKDVSDLVSFLQALPPIDNAIPASTFKARIPGAAPEAAPPEAAPVPEAPAPKPAKPAAAPAPKPAKPAPKPAKPAPKPKPTPTPTPTPEPTPAKPTPAPAAPAPAPAPAPE